MAALLPVVPRRSRGTPTIATTFPIKQLLPVFPEQSSVDRAYYTYILTNQRNTLLYIGITNCIRTRLWQHRNVGGSAFCKEYKIAKLVYFEIHDYPGEAIDREKQIKSWRRSKKIALINAANPGWRDLSEDFED